MKTKTRKRISLALVLCLAMCLVVGSFAFFTDRAELSGTAKAGNLSIAATGDISAALKLGGDSKISNSATLDNWNPGDEAPFSYEVENTGNKAVRVQETVVLEVTGVTEAQLADCMLTIDGAGTPEFEATANGYKLTYTVEDVILSGSEEVVEGKTDLKQTKEYTLLFNEDALNEYQDAEIAIDVTVDAIQYANTDAGDFATIEIEA